ncbi:MAG: hypothetical protein AB1489_41295 [Acidobacteriota bacterium]
MFTTILVRILMIFAPSVDQLNIRNIHVACWAFLGLVAGLGVSRFFNKKGQAIVIDLLLGIAGAIIGGKLIRVIGLWNDFNMQGVNILSLIIAIIVGTAFLLVYNSIYHKS